MMQNTHTWGKKYDSHNSHRIRQSKVLQDVRAESPHTPRTRWRALEDVGRAGLVRRPCSARGRRASRRTRGRGRRRLVHPHPACP